MSKPELQEVARLERVPEIDDGTLLRIRQVRPVEKAASPIIDHNLELIELAVGLRKWYQGKGVSTPHDLLGDSLDPQCLQKGLRQSSQRRFHLALRLVS